jgi:hypothetical protein
MIVGSRLLAPEKQLHGLILVYVPSRKSWTIQQTLARHKHSSQGILGGGVIITVPLTSCLTGFD